MAKGKDWVFCPDCGEEYERINNQHECDPRILEQIELEKKADEDILSDYRDIY